MAYTGWELSASDRKALLGICTPSYPDFIGHHITYRVGDVDESDIPPEAKIAVVGYADDDRGVQALVVEVDGKLLRPDGGPYHITWSIDRSRGRKPVDSNEVVRKFAQPLPLRINITANPKLF